jgi:uncharacterized coiled-coil protein SlyX
MPENRIEELEMKISFMERHLEEMDKAFVDVHNELRTLKETLQRLGEQQAKSSGSGDEESLEDAVPPHY